MMRARLFQPAKTAMSSGQGRSKGWVLEFLPDQARRLDPLMGWTASGDTQSQVRLQFEDKDTALAYAKDQGLEVDVQQPNRRKPNIRAQGYAENFATRRRSAWTH
jgi:NADH dehydrogenase